MFIYNTDMSCTNREAILKIKYYLRKSNDKFNFRGVNVSTIK